MKIIHIDMKKKLIRLTESDLHRIVRRSVNEVMYNNIHSYPIKEPYYKLMKAIDEFIKVIYDEYNVEGEIKEMVDALSDAEDKIHSWAAHPEGSHGERKWDSVGF